MKRILTTTCAGFALLLILTTTAMAQPWASEQPPSAHRELIVLLAPSDHAPSPKALIEGIERGRGLDPGFYAGQPEAARPALPFRARGEALARLQADPDNPRARLERYVVIRYPEQANLDAVMRALAARPDVLHVERNETGTIHGAAPPPFFDPLIPEQWGLTALDLPAAWERTVGNAFVGFVDSGLQVDHPDLRAFPFLIERLIQDDDGSTKEICRYGVGAYEQGNFRPQLSMDIYEGDCNVDERDPPHHLNLAGHGTHVAGIVGATAGNGQGVAGACPGCSLMMARAFLGSSTFTVDRSASGLTFLVDQGAQVVSMSWQLGSVDCSNSSLSMLCTALTLAESRDVVMTASSGNHKQDIGFPARDSRVMAIGGIEPDGDFWDFADDGGCPNATNTNECGSNFAMSSGVEQDLVTPAVQVLSTMYEGRDWNTPLGCGDSTHPSIGYGLCTGTSMASPYAAGVAGLVRSINPLLSKSQVREALRRTADRATAYDPKLGFGVPDAAAAVDAVLGTVAGRTLDNRLTPLFTLWSFEAATHLSTTVPQVAGAAIQDPWVGFVDVATVGQPPAVPGYPFFPASCAMFIGCQHPHAWVYLFSGPRSPHPGGPPLVPLYRMSFDEPWNGNLTNRSFFYTTETAGVERGKQIGYELDGIEGYIYQRCTPEPECIPLGAVRLYRLYHHQRDDYAIFPESLEAQFRNDGYVSQSGLNDWIGYVYVNVDTDSDLVIDAFESLAGTNPLVADSDCDGLSDGQELAVFDGDGYGDPLQGPCTAMNVHLADTFSTNGRLHGRTAETGGVAWTARKGAVVKGGTASDEGAVASVPFTLASVTANAEVAVSARINPSFSGWVGVGLLNKPTAAFWSGGQVWALVRPNGTYQVFGLGAFLTSGAIPGSAVNGFHLVEVRYAKDTRRATYLINGIQVHSAILASVPDVQHTGFHMYLGGEGSPRLDDFLVADVTSTPANLISDGFSGGGAIHGRATEVGGVTWTAKTAARVSGGTAIDAAAIGGLPLGPALLAGNPVVSVTAKVKPWSGSEWLGVGFASDAARAYWSIGQVWVWLSPGGSFKAIAGGGSVASGSIPGTAVNGFHQVEVRYETASRRARFFINGTEVGSQVLTSPPDLSYAGFHVHGGVGWIDDFQVLSTAAP